MSAGKGSSPRHNLKAYGPEWERIFVKNRRKVTDLSRHFKPGVKVTLIDDPDNEVARMFRETISRRTVPPHP